MDAAHPGPRDGGDEESAADSDDELEALASFDPEAVTGWTLVRAYQLIARRFYAVLAGVGLSPAHFGVLLELEQRPGTSQAALARTVFITPQAMGEMLTGMAEAGLVQRAPGRPGTPTAVTATNAGRTALARAIPRITALNAPPALGLDTEQDATLNTLLHTVRDTLDQS